MKKSVIMLFACAALSMPFTGAQAQNSASTKPAGASAAAPAFEGTMVWTMTSPAQLGDSAAHNMTIHMKGEKTMVEIDAGMQGTMHIYSDRVAKKMTMVMVEAGQGMEQPMPDEDKPEAVGSASDIDLHPTGKKAVIGGRNAEAYTMKAEQASVTFWMTGDIAPSLREAFTAASARAMKGSKKQKAAFRAMAEKGLFPIKIESSDATGASVSLDFVKLEQEKLADSVFEVPKDVQIMQPPKGTN